MNIDDLTVGQVKELVGVGVGVGVVNNFHEGPDPHFS
jgi:hypothetical protein